LYKNGLAASLVVHHHSIGFAVISVTYISKPANSDNEI
jgi:hypothetical protein